MAAGRADFIPAAELARTRDHAFLPDRGAPLELLLIEVRRPWKPLQ
jgi:hypothetical protein